MADTLTAAQILDIRTVIGDVTVQENGSNILSDTQIQTLYDTAQGKAILTYIYGLQRVAGYYIQKMNESSQMGYTSSHRNLWQNAKEMLVYWTQVYNDEASGALSGDITADTVNVQGIGTLNIFLDTTE